MTEPLAVLECLSGCADLVTVTRSTGGIDPEQPSHAKLGARSDKIGHRL